jgi:transposase
MACTHSQTSAATGTATQTASPHTSRTRHSPPSDNLASEAERSGMVVTVTPSQCRGRQLHTPLDRSLPECLPGACGWLRTLGHGPFVQCASGCDWRREPTRNGKCTARAPLGRGTCERSQFQRTEERRVMREKFLGKPRVNPSLSLSQAATLLASGRLASACAPRPEFGAVWDGVTFPSC